MAELLQNGAPPSSLSSQLGMTQVVEHLDLSDLLLERGTTGLRRAGGFVRDELLTELSGPRGVRIYKEMRDNSAIVGACLFAMEMLIRNVTWRVQAADDSLEAERYADVFEGMLFHDIDMPWSMLLSEILSMLTFGFSYHEMIFKRRLGPNPPMVKGIRQLPSCFHDGLIGFGKIAPRAQETVLRWEFDQTGTLAGMHQLDPWNGQQAYLPYEKCLLFRPTSYKDNPEGRSILRTAYRSWYWIKHIENTQGIGIERNVAGMPVIGAPPQWFTASATDDDLAQLEMAKRIVRNLRNDEQMGVVHPLIYDQNGKELFTFKLMGSSGSTNTMDTNAVIERHELRITQSMLADLIMLGHEAVGSFALHSGKTNLLGSALGGYLLSMDDVWNRRAIPLVGRLNAWAEDKLPTLAHGDVETVDLKELGQFIKDYAQAGFDVSDLDNHIRMLTGFPEREEGMPVMVAQQPEPDAVVTKRRRVRRARRRLAGAGP